MSIQSDAESAARAGERSGTSDSDELRRLRETVARIEALPAQWREYAGGLARKPKRNDTIATVRVNCAIELEAKLRGEP